MRSQENMIWPFKKKQTMQRPPEPSDAWPVFVNSMWAIACWTHSDRTRRVFLIQRKDETFGRWSEYFSDYKLDMCWIQEYAGGSFYGSEAIAIREIHDTYPWTKEVEPERKNAET